MFFGGLGEAIYNLLKDIDATAAVFDGPAEFKELLTTLKNRNDQIVLNLDSSGQHGNEKGSPARRSECWHKFCGTRGMFIPTH